MPPLSPDHISPTGARVLPRPDASVVSAEVAQHYLPQIVKLGAALMTAAELSASIAADERELAGLRRDVQMRIIQGVTV